MPKLDKNSQSYEELSKMAYSFPISQILEALAQITQDQADECCGTMEEREALESAAVELTNLAIELE